MNSKTSRAREVWRWAVLAAGLTAVIMCNFVDRQNKKLQDELASAKSEIAHYEERLECIENREIQLLGLLEYAEHEIEVKNRLLLNLQYQPCALVPCFSCGSQVILIEGEERDCYYIKCTQCTVLFGPYATIDYAKSEWNYVDE